MSSGHVSDAGDVGEGEGPKVVQSSFKDASIMNKSVAPKEQPPAEAVKPEGTPEEAKPEDSKQEAEGKQGSKKKTNKRFVDDFNFEIPKMKGVPILNKDTVNPYTFDLNYLLNPDVQKVAKSAHRLTQSNTAPNGKNLATPKNHIQKNIENSKKFSNSKSTKDIKIPEIAENKEKKTKFDVEERFYKKAKQTEEKIKNLKEEKEKQEINGCTFKPEIKAKRETKTYDEFYEYMKRYTEKKEKKITYLKEEESKAKEKSMDFSHQPKLCEKSLQMIARKSDLEESTFDRLHKLYKLQNKSISNRESVVIENKFDEGLTFHPSVNKKSQALSRSDPVEKILYEDALRRIHKEKNPPAPPPTKFITTKSEKVLIEKLKRDFEEAFMCIDAASADEINYTKMIELFKAMHFVKDDYKKEEERLLLLESWKILLVEGETYCKKSSILVFLIAVMGFYEDWMAGEDPSRLMLSPSDANKIHTKFDLFYSNRVSIVNKSTLNKSYKNNYEYSFHPQTVIESQALAKAWRSQNRAGGKIEDMLIAEKAKTLKKLEEKRQIMEEQALDECSFQPLIEQMPEEFRTYGLYEKEDLTSEYFKLLNDPKFQNKHKGILLHDLAKVVKQRKETMHSDNQKKKEENELESCTFNPKLEDRIFPNDYSPPEPRPKKHSFEESPKKSMTSSFASDSKAKGFNDMKKISESGAASPVKNPRVISNNGNMAVVGVTLAGKEEKLNFDIQNDDPSIKVLEFSQQFGLKKEMEYKLVKELTLLKTS